MNAISHDSAEQVSGTEQGVSLNPDLKQVYDFTIDIVDKQYRSYVWNDGKVQALIAVDTALIAGILVILQIYASVSTLSFLLLAISFLCLTVSFVICLVHAIPRVNSRIGNEANLRTMVGIGPLTKEEYHIEVLKLTLAEMVQMNCWQISGMCRNNLRSHYLIRRGVTLTICGVLALAMSLPLISLTHWNRTKLVQAPPTVQGPISPLPTSTSSSTTPWAP